MEGNSNDAQHKATEFRYMKQSQTFVIEEDFCATAKLPEKKLTAIS